MVCTRFSRLKWTILIAIEIFFVGIVLMKVYSQPSINLNFGQEELLYSTGENGFYIDTSENEIIQTPDFVLSPGMYTLKVKYSGEGESVICVQYADGRLNGNLSGNIPTGNVSKCECDFKIWYSDRPVHVTARMRGDAGAGDYLLIDEIIIESSPVGIWYLLLVLSALMIVCDIILYVFVSRYFDNVSSENKLIIKSLFIITLFSSIPLMVDYLPASAHDLQFHLMRIEGIKAGIQANMFPVKIQPNWLNGYGYAASVFYGDIFLYIPAILRLFGVSLQSSYQFYVLLVNIATVFCSYWCFAGMSSKKIGVVCSAVYSLNIYRLVNIYSRAAVGEYTAMIFLPLILYGFWCVYHFEFNTKEHRKSWIWIVLGCTGVFMSHMITCELVALFVVLACTILWKKTFKKQNFYILAKSVIIIIFLNIWFLIPFIDYMVTGRYVINAPDSWVPFRADERAAFVSQLFMNTYNVIGASQGHDMGIINEMPQTLGIVAIIVIGAWFLLYMGNHRTDASIKKEERMAVLFLGLSLILSTCLIPYTILGELIPFLQYPIRSIQYVWRFLALGAVFLAWLVVYILLHHDKVSKQERSCIAIVTLAVVFLQALSFESEILLKNEPLRVYDEGNLTTFEVAGGEYLPIESNNDKNFVRSLAYDSAVIEIEEWKDAENEIQISASNLSDSSQSVGIPLLYYKGYEALDENGTTLDISAGVSGRISVGLPAGYAGTFTIKFIEPWYWRAAEIMSLFVAIFLVFRIKRMPK